jgi:biopolymer transport protein ExbB/TolQ
MLLAITVLLPIVEVAACTQFLRDNAWQQGELQPRETNEGNSRAFAHQLTDIKIVDTNRFSHIIITEIFSNNGKENLSATYSLPLPENAALESISVRQDEQFMRSNMDDNKEVETYLRLIDDTQEIAERLDQNRPHQLTQSIPNIAPGEEIEIVVTYREKIYEGTKAFQSTVAPVGGEEDFCESGVLSRCSYPTILVYITLMLIFLYALSLIIERLMTYTSAGSQSRRFVARVHQYLLPGQLPEALNISGYYPKSPVANILGEVFKAVEDHPQDELRLYELCASARGRAIGKSDAELRRGLRSLKTAGWLALMLGSLGAILNLLELFQYAAVSEGTGLSAFAGGIAESFTIALFGLLIFVPVLWAGKYLSAKAMKVGLETDKASWELLDSLLKRRAQERAVQHLQTAIWSDC